MTQALWIWRQFPRQIATDLRRYYPGLHIKHWHRGTRGADGDLLLSSYELLELLEFLPEDSAFKTQAERGGYWPDWKRMLAEAANQGYRMHASYLTRNGVEGVSDTSEYEFVDPIIGEARAKAAALEAANATNAQERFESEIGFSGRRPTNLEEVT